MLTLGIKNEKTITVTADLLATHVGSGSVDVFATPAMISCMEDVSKALVEELLEEGRTTVGIQVNVSHIAATPEGMKVTISSELVSISENGKILTFRVEAFDEAEKIGEGTHQRAIISKERFEQKAKAKLG
ncbi:MAG: thioesterase family protein [Lachnospiraceae bacterium]|nr:thioesterase family protein [Lachnospiraceae bacterium]